MGTIVVGVDGSPDSQRALAWAVKEAELRGDDVEALLAYQLPADIPPYVAASPEGTDFERAASDRLASVVDEVDQSGLARPVRRTVVDTSPSRALLAASESADLVVTGTRGHGGFTGLLLGSVSHQLSAHARCPVVIVPHQKN